MAEEIKSDDISEGKLDQRLAEIIDYATFNKIINKLTDYAEILSQGKMSSIINFNYRLNSIQTNDITKFLEDIQGISRIYSLSVKGSKDIEVEYVSNIYSDYENPETISSYLNLKNILENRLTHQVQQYNMIMGKNNTTMSIPLNELRGHVKTYRDLSELDFTISPKAQHGIIAVSLHDAYTTLLNKPDYWNEKSYVKFFFNEDDQSKKKILLLKKEKRLSLREIACNVKEILDDLHAVQFTRTRSFHDASTAETAPPQSPDYFARRIKTETFTDRMLLTPFGKQYGSLIEKIINGIFDPDRKTLYDDNAESQIKEKIGHDPA
jgi:hypothetical protein